MAPPIPDRWLDYKPIGERIEGTRFIAFKVPLREHIIKNVDPKIQLDGDILLKTVPNMGMIIDLTNTNRYYNPESFQSRGVEHCKLMIPGHVTPPKPLVNRFKEIVAHFIKSNADNDKLIGVHCTHGVNRTGYMICNYMISEMKIDPLEAIKRFDIARGHNIERSNYLQSLQQQLNNPEDNRTESRNDYSNWRTQDRSRGPHAQANREFEIAYNNDRFKRNQINNDAYNRNQINNDAYNRNQNNVGYNGNQRPMPPNSSLRSYEQQHNHRPRLQTDYYSARPMRHRTQHVPRFQTLLQRDNPNSPNL